VPSYEDQDTRWNEAAIERFGFGQFLLHLQHERMREEAGNLGLLVYGDLHIGCSHQDWWCRSGECAKPLRGGADGTTRR